MAIALRALVPGTVKNWGSTVAYSHRLKRIDQALIVQAMAMVWAKALVRGCSAPLFYKTVISGRPGVLAKNGAPCWSLIRSTLSDQGGSPHF